MRCRDRGGAGGPAADVELGVDVVQVPLDRADAQSERAGDLFVVVAVGGEAENLELARRDDAGDVDDAPGLAGQRAWGPARPRSGLHVAASCSWLLQERLHLRRRDPQRRLLIEMPHWLDERSIDADGRALWVGRWARLRCLLAAGVEPGWARAVAASSPALSDDDTTVGKTAIAAP